jgi:hypothetical protein
MLQATDHDPSCMSPFAHCSGTPNQQVNATPSFILKQQWRHGQEMGSVILLFIVSPCVLCLNESIRPLCSLRGVLILGYISARLTFITPRTKSSVSNWLDNKSLLDIEWSPQNCRLTSALYVVLGKTTWHFQSGTWNSRLCAHGMSKELRAFPPVWRRKYKSSYKMHDTFSHQVTNILR